MIVRVFFSKYGLVPCTYTNVTIKIQFFRAGKSGFRMWISGPSVQKSLQKSNFFSTGGAPAHENKKQKRKVNIAKKIKSQNPTASQLVVVVAKSGRGGAPLRRERGRPPPGECRATPPLPDAALPLPTTVPGHVAAAASRLRASIAGSGQERGAVSRSRAGKGRRRRSRPLRCRLLPLRTHFPPEPSITGRTCRCPSLAAPRPPVLCQAGRRPPPLPQVVTVVESARGPAPPTVARCREKVSDERVNDREKVRIRMRR